MCQESFPQFYRQMLALHPRSVAGQLSFANWHEGWEDTHRRTRYISLIPGVLLLLLNHRRILVTYIILVLKVGRAAMCYDTCCSISLSFPTGASSLKTATNTLVIKQSASARGCGTQKGGWVLDWILWGICFSQRMKAFFYSKCAKTTGMCSSSSSCHLRATNTWSENDTQDCHIRTKVKRLAEKHNSSPALSSCPTYSKHKILL